MLAGGRDLSYCAPLVLENLMLRPGAMISCCPFSVGTGTIISRWLMWGSRDIWAGVWTGPTGTSLATSSFGDISDGVAGDPVGEELEALGLGACVGFETEDGRVFG